MSLHDAYTRTTAPHVVACFEVNVELNRRQFIEVAAAAVPLMPLDTQGPQNDTEDPDNPLGVRRDFPVVREGLYLNSAYIAPVPVPVADAARLFNERKTSKPIPLDEMLQKTGEVRGQFAKLVGAEAEEIGFLFATSEGENIVASALDLKPGDNVVVDELHYNTTFVLYRHLEETRGIALRIVKHRDGRVTVDDVARAVDDRTRLLSVAWVSHQNGFRHDMRPLADVAHAHGALFYADAVQALGMFPADVRAAGVDCMTSGTYKWLLGGFGVAPFFIRRELLEKVRVDRLGALHVEKELGDHRYEIYRTARKFEYATLPFAEIYQLGAALAYLERVGVGRIERHTVALARELREGLAGLGFRLFTPPDNHSSIVSVRLDKNQTRAREVLDGEHVQVSFRENGSLIRVSPALFNTRDEIRRFLDAAKRFA
jgi:selenocysteine lyase/cysteine desulfurase